MKNCAVIGLGPAGLMVASVLADAGLSVTLFEKKRTPKKLLIAGRSGLNITNGCDETEFPKFYGHHSDFMKNILAQFSREEWLKFIASLGIKTFLGTSRRYFVEGMKASKLLRAWLNKLKNQGVQLSRNHELADFSALPDGRIQLNFTNGFSQIFDAVCLCLGGGSYEKNEQPLRWVELLKSKGIGFVDFRASNVGYEVKWPAEFLLEAEGKPLKNVKLTTPKGALVGDLLITHYGLEGTPVYTLGVVGESCLDLKPDQSKEVLLKKISPSQTKRSPFHLVKKYLNLCPASLSLLFHYRHLADFKNPEKIVELIKQFPLVLENPRPLDEAISSAGGVKLTEINEHLMLKKMPGVFMAGEMLDWDAPTGGFLIQACVSQGYVAGSGMLDFFHE
ncbi:MAG: hypothetical protein ACD_73C00345G0001 [uncultured bacterium]|nr:MAG: hypothetical protein ACD_73C00345G0001 [uncultured bacterium]